MDRSYLLTYIKCDFEGNSWHTFDWFETEEEMKNFIKENKETIIKICEAQEILSARNIKIS